MNTGGLNMPKYLIAGSYRSEGLKGLQHDKASGRRHAVSAAIEALGGKLESVHFALGEDDVYVICELPDYLSVTALALSASATGMIRTRTVQLLTVEETDQVLGRTVSYRAPGG
jgi:uncharacterized protein with GYD domain